MVWIGSMVHKPAVIKILLLGVLINGALLVITYRSVPSEYKLLFLGDLAFGESYQAQAGERHKTNILKEYGYDHCLEQLAKVLSRSDLVICHRAG